MSDPVESWIDVDELRQLAASLSEPVAEPELEDKPAEGESFKGFEAEDEAVEEVVEEAEESRSSIPPQISQALAKASQVANASGLLAAAAEKVAPEKPLVEFPFYQVPEGVAPEESLTSSQVIRFCEWLQDGLSASGVFFCDSKSQLLRDGLESPRLVTMAKDFALAKFRHSAESPEFSSGQQIQVGPGSILVVVSAQTRHGLIIVGALTEAMQPVEVMAEVGRSLRLACS